MMKYIVLMMLPFLANACAHDEAYYRLHMTQLQAVINQCPTNPPTGVTCVQLQKIALNANALADELRMSPQGFGQKILSLQEAISADKASLKINKHQPALQESIMLHKRQLDERLAVVKWLESPRA